MLDGFPSLEIPAIRTLALYRQWVLWRLEPSPSDPTKLTKIPYAHEHYRASSTKAASWATLNEVYEASVRHAGLPYTGVGFVFDASAGNDIMGVDLDKCRDPETGVIEPEFREIVDKFKTYTEVSPSGTGVHMLCRGQLPPGARRKFRRIEVYSDARYFTVTGNHLDGTPEEIEERQDAIDWLVQKLADTAAGVEEAAQPKLRVANGHYEQQHRADAAKINGHAHAAPRDDGLLALLEPEAQSRALCSPRLLAALRANSRRFDETWDHTRKDAKDWSASEFDMALASYMTAAGWPPQEIIRGLIQHRREQAYDLKLNRRPACDYYLRTIRAARQQQKRDEAQDVIAAAAQRTAASSEPVPRDSLLDALSTVYNCEIKAIQRYSGDEPGYVIRTSRGDVRGSISTLTSQSFLRNAFAETCGLVIPKAKASEHDKRVQAMLDLCEHMETGPDAQLVLLVRYWLVEYLNGQEISQSNGVLSNDPNRPLMIDGRYAINGTGFCKWLAEHRGQRMTVVKLARVLKELRCEPHEEMVDAPPRRGDKPRRTRMNFWMVHPGVLE